jgi:hypothetical protein
MLRLTPFSLAYRVYLELGGVMAGLRKSWAAVVCAALALAGTAQAQDEAKRYKTGQIKIGDRVEIPWAGKWTPCTVLGARLMPGDPSKIDAYQIRCDQGYPSDAIADTDHVRPSAASAPSWNVVDAAKVGPKGANAYGARNPHTCGPVRAGGLTPAVAVQAFICGSEHESGHQLWLVENVSVRIVGPTRYDPHIQTGFTNLDVSVPPYAITGSYVQYQCDHQEADPKAYGYNYDRNCARYVERNAKGYCWKNRAAAWSCVMNDLGVPESDKNPHTAPPR